MKKLIILLLILCLIPAVSALPPKMVMTVSGTGGAAPYTIEVSEDSGDETIVTWEWVFGDGGTSKDKRTIYVYERSGEYTLQLTVSNDKGESAVDAVLITVTGAVETQPPTPIPTPIPKPTPDENTIVNKIWTGTTPIKDSLATKAQSEIASTIKTAIDTSLKLEKYPLEITTEFKILKYRCEDEKCGYWISATRGGRDVKTNSPVWLINGNAPIDIVVSDTYDDKTNIQTAIMKEDPKLAAFNTLQIYVNQQPIGTPIVGTKE